MDRPISPLIMKKTKRASSTFPRKVSDDFDQIGRTHPGQHVAAALVTGHFGWRSWQSLIVSLLLHLFAFIDLPCIIWLGVERKFVKNALTPSSEADTPLGLIISAFDAFLELTSAFLFWSKCFSYASNVKMYMTSTIWLETVRPEDILVNIFCRVMLSMALGRQPGRHQPHILDLLVRNDTVPGQ